MRITSLSLSLVTLLLTGVLGGAAHAQRKDAAAAQITAMLGTSRPALAVAAPLIELGDLGVEPAPPGHGRPAEPAPVESNLAARDVAALVNPHGAALERCYLDEAGTPSRASRLDLTLAIARDGHLLSVKAAAPGLAGKAARRVAGCVRSALDDVQFPARRHDTTAVVPYVFQRTTAPEAGPQLSCWDPKGCR